MPYRGPLYSSVYRLFSLPPLLKTIYIFAIQNDRPRCGSIRLHESNASTLSLTPPVTVWKVTFYTMQVCFYCVATTALLNLEARASRPLAMPLEFCEESWRYNTRQLRIQSLPLFKWCSWCKYEKENEATNNFCSHKGETLTQPAQRRSPSAEREAIFTWSLCGAEH